MQDVNDRGNCVSEERGEREREGIWESSTLSVQFFSKPKIALKNHIVNIVRRVSGMGATTVATFGNMICLRLQFLTFSGQKTSQNLSLCCRPSPVAGLKK